MVGIEMSVELPQCSQRIHPTHTAVSGLNQNKQMNIPQTQRTV